ncbi:hypothetical protein MNV49_000223 [Pseudohyphozyma bogoriensis]|nr:hypothetical protein MNV49_000223 [Pseudohyphozyma bogoriensis]
MCDPPSSSSAPPPPTAASPPPEPSTSSFASLLPGDAPVPPAPSPSPPPAPAPAPAPAPPSTSTPITLITTFLNGTTRTWPLVSYYPAPSSSSSAADSTRAFLALPDSYFSPTPTELQAAFAGQVKKREELVDRPLLTGKLREREEKGRRDERERRWPQTKIRIRFADRSQLEGTFNSTDLLGAVYEFVKAALEPSIRQTPFTLYQTPPKRDYVRTDPAFKGKNLLDLSLAPSSVFYIRFEDDNLNSPSKPPPLRAEVLDHPSALPTPPSFDPTAKEGETKGKGSAAGSGKKMGFGGASGTVTPSWMRLGGKNVDKIMDGKMGERAVGAVR